MHGGSARRATSRTPAVLRAGTERTARGASDRSRTGDQASRSSGRKSSAWTSVVRTSTATRASATAPVRVRTRCANTHGASRRAVVCRFAALPSTSHGAVGSSTGTAATTTRSAAEGTASAARTKTPAHAAPVRTQQSVVTVRAYHAIGSANPTSTTSRGTTCRYPAYGSTTLAAAPRARCSRKKSPASSAHAVPRATGPSRTHAASAVRTPTPTVVPQSRKPCLVDVIGVRR